MKGILLTDEGKLQVINRSLEIGEVSEQNVKLLFATAPGEWKDNPQVGINFPIQKNGSLNRFLDRVIRIQMQIEGFNIDELELSENGVQIAGSYDL